MAIRSNGTHLYYVDDITNPDAPEVKKLECPTGIEGIDGGQRNKMDATCLDDETDERQITGLATPNDMTAPYNFDPSKDSHRAIPKMKKSGKKIKFAVGFADGKGAPTFANGKLTLPSGRTFYSFTAEVSDNPISVQSKDIVKGTLTLARDGAGEWSWNGTATEEGEGD